MQTQEEKLDIIVNRLVENIDSRVKFYSDEDREFFIENVVNIILLSEEDKLEYNLYCFLEHNYSNYGKLQQNLNEGIGSFVKGVFKGIGRAVGFGKPAEKIAFGAPPTTAVAGKDGKDGKDSKEASGGGSGGSGGSGGGKSAYEAELEHQRILDMRRSGATHDTRLANAERRDSGPKIDLRGVGAQGDVDASSAKSTETTTIKGDLVTGDKSGGDMLKGNAQKAGGDISNVKASGNAQVATGRVEDNRKQSVSTTSTGGGGGESKSTIALPNTQGQKSAAEAKTRQSMGKQAFIDKYGADEGAKRHAAYRGSRNASAKQRASARAAAANQATQNTKQTATVDSKGGSGGAGGEAKTSGVDFGAGAKGHTFGDGGKQSASVKTNDSSPAPASKPEPKPAKKSSKKKAAEPVAESVTDLYADYLSKMLKG